jgi:hypothetical protein
MLGRLLVGRSVTVVPDSDAACGQCHSGSEGHLIQESSADGPTVSGAGLSVGAAVIPGALATRDGDATASLSWLNCHQ